MVTCFWSDRHTRRCWIHLGTTSRYKLLLVFVFGVCGSVLEDVARQKTERSIGASPGTIETTLQLLVSREATETCKDDKDKSEIVTDNDEIDNEVAKLLSILEEPEAEENNFNMGKKKRFKNSRFLCTIICFSTPDGS